MKTKTRVLGILLMITLAASFAAAFEKPAIQVTQGAAQLQIGAQDVITASDAGGGYLTTRDIVLIVVIIFAVIGLAFVL